jgi:tRNA-Thr(GGU) m(6)t(6)A37 methyltransferase TsaA
MGKWKTIQYTPIGIVHSPFKKPEGTPIQSAVAEDAEGTVEVFPEYKNGLDDLDGFSHIILLCHLQLVKDPKLKVIPFMDDQPHGVFSTRSPNRPNPIGLSIVELVRIENNILHIKNLDIIDGTPLLDIKPFIPGMDNRETTKIGWLERNIQKMKSKKDDGRFV